MPTCPAAVTGHKGGSPCLFPTVFQGGAGGGLLADGRGQLEAGADAQLLVGAAEVAFDGLLGHEQRLCDLAVGLPFCHLMAHPPLGRGQCVRPGQLDPCAAPGPACSAAIARSASAMAPQWLARLMARRWASRPSVRLPERLSSAPRPASA